MVYIGKSPAQVKRDLPEKDTFTGDGSTTTFDLTNDALSANTIQVFVDNVRQEPGTGKSYTLGEDGSGNLRRITFTAAPDSSAEIYVINEGTKTSVLNTLSDGSVTEAKLGTGAVTSAKISDGTIANADVSPSAAIADSKLATITTASKVNVSALSAPGSADVFLRGDRTYGAIPTDQIDTNAFNISLLGFKMAVNEGLTVFNLVDGIVDEFHDESGTDEAEGSNDLYCATSDLYKNATAPVSVSAGFTTTAVTEGDTSTAGTNPTPGSGTFGTFTVPSNLTAVTINSWGAGGASQAYLSPCRTSASYGGGGGFSTGTLAVTPVLSVVVGEGGQGAVTPSPNTKHGGLGGGGGEPSTIPTSNDGMGGAGGGMSGAFVAPSTSEPTLSSAPQAYLIAGGGGGSGLAFSPSPQCRSQGGQGGGLVGLSGADVHPAQTSHDPSTGAGGGGDQEQGGGSNAGPEPTSDGSLFNGGSPACGQSDQFGGGGGGYYGGGSGGPGSSPGTYGAAGGGGSGYIAHPQVTSGTFGASEDASSKRTGAGIGSPLYVPGTNEGATANVPISAANGEDGYMLITGNICGSTTSTTIISTAFTSTAVPTTSRIVVFQENVDTPTLNTDIIASISRDGGSNFTTATLSDSGYVTGSSGQRILTGQATISGQPSGQSMRWKLALANNTVKIHGVSLQWA